MSNIPMTDQYEFIRTARMLQGGIKQFYGSEVPLEYLSTGHSAGETILFVHGMMANLRHFFPNVPHFAPRYRTLCVSLRGHGNSGCPQPELREGYALARMANDLRQLIDHLGIDTLHYVGHSMGGMVGYELYKHYPHYFKTMTNLGTPVQLNFQKWIVSLGNGLQSQALKLLGPIRLAKFFADQATKSSASLNFLLAEVMNPVNWQAARLEQLNVAEIDYRDVLQQVEVPTLVLQGEWDPATRKQWPLIEKAAKSNARITTHIIQGGGHVANLDQPQLFNRLLEDFLTKKT